MNVMVGHTCLLLDVYLYYTYGRKLHDGSKSAPHHREHSIPLACEANQSFSVVHEFSRAV